MAFDTGQGSSILGGAASGNSSSTATQSAVANFIPDEIPETSSPLVSTYPAGDGFATLGTLYPSAAATTAPATSTTSTTSSTLIYLALAAAAAFFLWKRGMI